MANSEALVDSVNQVLKYNSGDEKWEKIDIGGILFVYLRGQKPQHGFVKIHWLSTTNLVEPLDFQDQTPFLLYCNGKGSVYGMWLYKEKNCLKFFKLLLSLLKFAIKPDKSNSIRQRSYSKSKWKHQRQKNSQIDIISLLTSAQDECDKIKSELTELLPYWIQICNPGEMTDAMDNLHLRVSRYVPQKQLDFMPIIVSRLHREMQQRLLVCCKEENLFLDSLQMLGIEVMVLNRELRKNFDELKKRSVDKLAKNGRLQDVLNSCEVLLAPTANCFYEDVRAVSFDTCIVFDADHFTEPDSVMCLSYDVRHLVLVGTPDKKCDTSKLTATWDYGSRSSNEPTTQANVLCYSYSFVMEMYFRCDVF